MPGWPASRLRRARRGSRTIRPDDATRIARNGNALSRPLDRSLRRQFSLVERHPHPQGHGALWRRVAGGDRPRLREAPRPRGRAGPRQGLVRGMARARRSDREARRRGARQGPQDHRRRLLPPRRHLSLQRRALHPARARRRRRSARTPTRSGTRASGFAIRTSNSSRCPTKAPPCPRCSCQAQAAGPRRPSSCSTAWTTPRR